MKHFLSSFALTLGLLVPVLAACSGATTDEPSSGADGTAAGASATEPVETVDSDIKSGKKKKSCASVGGACVGLSPSSCTDGHWADASKVSCGGGIGAGCCISCPVLSPPSPSFCPGGKIVPRKGANGCIGGYDCVPPPPPPPPQDCPELVQPPPGFCPGGSIVPRHDASTGCIVGFDCVPAPTNACAAAGGTCVGLAPSSCAAGHWADATTHSCGGGIGVGCCMP
jgi:hypothetical protein